MCVRIMNVIRIMVNNGNEIVVIVIGLLVFGG